MIEFLDLFNEYYTKVDPGVDPVVSPELPLIQFQVIAGQFPVAVELLAQGFDGVAFKVKTKVASFDLFQGKGTADSIEVYYAEDGSNFERIFEVFPRLSQEFSFTLAEFSDFVATKGNIFDYFIGLLDTQDPAKAAQLDFPGGSLETAFALPGLGAEGVVVPGQVFDLTGNEDQDYFSFVLSEDGLDVQFTALPGSPVQGGVSLSLFDGLGVQVGESVDFSEGSGQFARSGLAAGSYYLKVDADEGANLLYSVQLTAASDLPELPPFVLDASNAQLLYVAYYCRAGDFPAENEGIDFWKNILEGAGPGFSYSPKSGDPLTEAERPVYEQIVDDFGQGEEYLGLFEGKSNAEKMDAIYQYCFGRNAEPDPLVEGGKNYWVDRLDRGWISLPQAAMEVALGAQGADLNFLANRVSSANIFFQQLDTEVERSAYAGSDAGAIARTWLQGFGATAATAEDADAVIAQIVAAASPVI